MSSATPSHSAPPASDEYSFLRQCGDRLVYGIRATAFWTAAVLPLLVLASVAIGTAGQYPAALAGALAINVVCAVVGHPHAPNDDR